MGLFDQIASGLVKSVFQEVESRALPALLQQMLKGTDLGSIGGLLGKLQESGLDKQVSSWLGNGANMQISPDDLRGALGSDRLRELAQRMGLPIEDLLGTLSRQLPEAVDQMSPNGTLEEDAPPSASGGSLADQAGLSDIKA